MDKHIFCLFLDDSKQKRSCLPELGPTIGIGGLIIDIEAVREVEERVNSICEEHSLPNDCEIKWSPDKHNWMYKNIIDDKRQSLFLDLATLIRKYACTILVVIEDLTYKPCCGNSHEESVLSLVFERYERFLEKNNSKGIIVIDSPSGDKKEEERFASDTMRKMQNGTLYVKNKNFLMNAFTVSSKTSRLIQIADLIIGSALSRVAHDHELAKTIFDTYKSLFDNDGSCFGGIGFKLHPGVRHRNLYKWLLGDDQFYEGSGKYSELPNSTTPYASYPYRI